MNKLKERIDYQERLSRVITFIHDQLSCGAAFVKKQRKAEGI